MALKHLQPYIRAVSGSIQANTVQTAYYIAFGAHGPRAGSPPGEAWKVLAYTGIGVGVSFVIFMLIRMGAGGAPSTMNKEYQEATNEYLKVCSTSHLRAGWVVEGYG